ncbi:WD40 repeat domain-containing protein [Novipirellula sp. SH528]|uniref:WD40 repeat domain-containing protein n=1 Tax=Novipirellula sp. SH528 TaxID=3454466 RepID=UPI003FA06A0A
MNTQRCRINTDSRSRISAAVLTIASLLLTCTVESVNSAEVRSVETGDSVIVRAEYSPNSHQVALGTSDGRVLLLDTDTGIVDECMRLSENLMGLAWSPNGKALVAGGMTTTSGSVVGKVLGEIRIWDTETKRVRWKRDFPDIVISDVDVSASGKTLGAFGGHVTEAKFDSSWTQMWRASNGVVFSPTFQKSEHCIRKALFSPDGKSLFGTTMQQVYQWPFNSSTERKLGPEFGRITDLDLSPNGRFLAVSGRPSLWGSQKGHVEIWDIESGQAVSTVDLPNPHYWTASVCFSPNSERLVIGTSDPSAQVIVVTVPDGRLIAALNGHESPVCAVAYSHDGTRMVSADEKGCVKVWDATDTGDIFWFAEDYVWNGDKLSVAERESTNGDSGRQVAIYDRSQRSGKLVSIDSLFDVTDAELNLSGSLGERLDCLAVMKNLRVLSLVTDQTTEANLGFLGTFSALESLDIHKACLSKGSIGTLPKLETVRELKIGNDQMSMEDLALLGELLPSVERLSLEGESVDFSVIASFSAFDKLKQLELPATSVINSEHWDRSQLPGLESLRLGMVDDKTLAKLAEGKAPKFLEFDASNCTENGLLAVSRMNGLVRYKINNSPLTVAAIDMIISKKLETADEQVAYCDSMRESIREKIEGVGEVTFEMAEKSDPASGRRLREIERKVAALQMLVEECRSRPSSYQIHGGYGFFSSIMSRNADMSANITRRLVAERDIQVWVQEHKEIAVAMKDKCTRDLAKLTKEEIQFGQAFGLL